MCAVEIITRTWVNCPLCEGKDYRPVYETVQYAGQHLGSMNTTLVMCEACDFVYNNPRPGPETLAKHYQSSIHASGQIYRADTSGGATQKVHHAQLAFLAEQNPNPKTLLDVGCGQGHFLGRAERFFTGVRVAGLEPSDAAVKNAELSGLRVHHGTLENFGEKLGTFDMVCAFSVLEHIGDPLGFLNLLKPLLAPGGHLFLEVPESTVPVPGLVEFFDFEHLGHFTSSTLQMALNRAGLNMTAIAEDMRPGGRLVVSAVVADSSGQTLPSIDRELEKTKFLTALENYQDEMKTMADGFRTRLLHHIAQWEKQDARIAVYGAGLHSEYLLGVLAELGPRIHCFLDSDPRKQGQKFHNWQVFGPHDISELNLHAILISSQRFEDEIFDTLKPHRETGLSVIRCYCLDRE